ncbi:hypothetical protein P2H44_22745 [Albimonas sp. CAU 1670]|uniref:hypothetical protein n=1 Tax=Albimonas sp. CAU 1670 TaxID=3032599 RepID=UPI0023DA3354|nr:hypothetical protein [Albimonas sp. CAU 1670]MDF2235384.1 hypothetical protein [Albimonas sp. CAU 1670]
MSGGKKTGRAQATAKTAAERVAKGRETAEQLSLLAPAAGDQAQNAGDRAPVAAQGEGPRGPGRPAGARNRAKRPELRRWLAAQGFQQPEQVLAKLAGLDQRGRDPLELAMARAEALLAWAEEGARPTVGADGKQTGATTGQRLELALTFWREQRAANEALLPYGLAKVTPDTSTAPPVTVINLPGAAQGQPGDAAQLVEGRAEPVGPSDFAPPPLPAHVLRNQGLADGEDPEGDA